MLSLCCSSNSSQEPCERKKERGRGGRAGGTRCCQPPLVVGRGKKERPSASRRVREGSKPRSRVFSSGRVRRGGKREGLWRKEVVEGRKKKVDGRGRSLSDSVPKTGVFGRNRFGNRRQHGVVIRRPLAAAPRWRPSAFGWGGVAATRSACLWVVRSGARSPKKSAGRINRCAVHSIHERPGALWVLYFRSPS